MYRDAVFLGGVDDGLLDGSVLDGLADRVDRDLLGLRHTLEVGPLLVGDFPPNIVRSSSVV
ncbi:hypothetical protein [Halobiforma nitratireducens]|uniref:hypothetical protein n=1 Tax=Halobiforma nitratireducens TaxID=130048 RepID=UPI001EF9F3A9|nr:hypothetical protein [Halobiforma nitratireducens]